MVAKIKIDRLVIEFSDLLIIIISIFQFLENASHIEIVDF